MHFNLSTLKALLSKVPAVVAALPEFKEVFDTVITTFNSKDQAALQQTYDKLIAENDEGFRELDAKAAEAEKR